jgi:flagellar biosynthesis/type III secretory pathway protein FliH
VQQALVELQGSRNGGLLEFEEDPRIERGGCVVVSESGTVDSQPSTKLQQLRSLSEG